VSFTAPPKICASFRAGGELCPDGISNVLDYARLSEKLGFADFDAADHVALTRENEGYPGGEFRWPPDSFWPDPLVVLAAVGAVTSSIQLTTSVLVIPLRPAIVVAKMAASIDNLTGGRLRLGIGSGWNRAEFDAEGVPFARRTARMVDYVGACRALWEGAPASFSSETVSFTDLWCSPRPGRAGAIPVLLGGRATRETADRIARVAEGWIPMNSQRDEVAPGVEYLREAFESAGRDPSGLIVRVAIPEAICTEAYTRDDPSQLLEELDRLAALGATDFKIYLSGLAATPDEVESVLRWISSACALPSPTR
jgi:probable F420-dependent oxidoreductase